MKHPSFIKVSIVSVFIGLLGVGWPGQGVAQEAILTGDATVAPAKPAGSSRMPASSLRVVGPLRVHSEQRAYLKFDFSPLPTGVTGTNIVKATLVLYVNTLRHAGSFDVVAVNGVWNENTVTSATVPAPIEVEATNVAIAVGEFVTVDLTGLVRDWVEGGMTNNGLALIPNGTGVDVSFDSKEGGAHSAQLSIITSVTSNQLAAGTVGLANLVPAITNVTVMAGAGLSGGGQVGLGGTTTLSIPAGGVANTMLANSAVTVTAGSGLSGGGTVALGSNATISANLNHDLTLTGNGGAVALGVNLANANIWTAPQTITGNLTVTGDVQATRLNIGAGNTLGGNFATIAGGQNNIATNNYATVPGGNNNVAGGVSSFAAGQHAQALNNGAFVWADGTGGTFSSTANNTFLIRASGGVGIGTNNPASALHVNGTVTANAFVGNGSSLTNVTPANGSVTSNQLAAGTVGLANLVPAITNVTVTAGTGLSGGGRIGLGGTTTLSIPTGGVANAMLANSAVTITAGSGLSGGGTVALGASIAVANNLNHDLTLTGNGGAVNLGLNLGNANTWTASQTINGGLIVTGDVQAARLNVGTSNILSGNFATIAGGQNNIATNRYATVPGGSNNVAGGASSFAAGQQAQALNNGAFVWSDGTGGTFSSISNNTFLIRASGGVGIGTNDPVSALQVIGTVTATAFVGDGSGVSNVTGTVTDGSITSNKLAAGTVSLANLVPAITNVTVTAGAGLSGGGPVGLGGTTTLSIPASGVANAMLANSAVTITAGSGLSGGGTVALGASIAVSNDLNHDLTLTGNGGAVNLGLNLGNANTWTASQTINGGLIVTGDVLAARLNVGTGNVLSGNFATIAGGSLNTASNIFATVPGGNNNVAGGASSFAAGNNAQALNDYTFVWSDGTGGNFSSVSNNTFLIQASGFVGINTNSPVSALHVNGTVTASNFVGAFIGDGSGLTNLVLGNGSVTSNQLAAGTVGLANLVPAITNVTVTAGAGLSGGGPVGLGGSTTLSIPASGVANAMLANSAVTITAGSGLSGGGTVALGASIAVSNDLNHDLTLAGNGGAVNLGLNLGNANTWTASQTFNGGLTVTGDVLAAGSLTVTGDVQAARLNVGIGNTLSGSQSTIAGGANNTASNDATVAGGYQNTASDFHTTVGGGANNTASSTNSTVAGGNNNTASGLASVSGGGANNIASGSRATVGGGLGNTASGLSAVVGGGANNIASGGRATVSGGFSNIASGVGAFIGGGGRDSSSTGSNVASGAATVIGGGNFNIASGNYATVPGGSNNLAKGVSSFAAGQQAQALNTGAFVWSDSTGGSFSSISNNTFLIRASGGVGIGTNNPVSALQVNGTVTATKFVGDGSQLTGTGGTGSTLSGSNPTVAGGYDNTASASYATVAGGYSNIASGVSAFIGGGGYDGTTYGSNVASGAASVIGGGLYNIAGNDYAFVGGGEINIASGLSATIGGGSYNIASNYNATVAGGDRNVAGGDHATVGGGYQNIASGTGAFVGGGGYDGTSYIGNIAVGEASVVGGGLGNSATNDYATIAGGRWNLAGGYSFVGGGNGNIASGYGAFVGGGGYDGTTDFGNVAVGGASVVGGGLGNSASNNYDTVGGGNGNTASGGQSFVGGGSGNTANGSYATLAGGNGNTASGGYSFVGGGSGNAASGIRATIGGGSGNTASGKYATVDGGQLNTASASHATVAGGSNNVAKGVCSFAAGNQANATNTGAFVWSDTSGSPTYSSTNNEFTARASGGVRFFSNKGATLGAQLAPNATAWTVLSDRNAKENIEAIDPREVLAQLIQMPVSRWSYKADPAQRRYIGPMAQDFHAAFGLGNDDKRINTLDTEGITLAAIQGLYQQMQQENAELRQHNAALEKRLADLEHLIGRLVRPDGK